MTRARILRAKRWAAVLVIAAVCAALVPRPAGAASHPCHQPVSQTSWQSAEHPCNLPTHAACVAMPGCAGVSAVVSAPDAGLPALPDTVVVEPGTPVAHDLASRGPPTPPPNS